MRIQTHFKINERLVVEDLNMKHKQVDNTETRSPEGNKKTYITCFQQANLQAKIFSLETKPFK